MSTEQKVAVITGASQGIGAALVEAYLEQNYSVVCDLALHRTIAESSHRHSTR